MFHLRGQIRASARMAACGMLAGFGAALASSPAAAQDGDRWTADETEARAALPLPPGNAAVTGAALSCAAQRWMLEIALAEGTFAGEGEAELRVDGNAFAVRAAGGSNGLAIGVPRAAIEPIKRGLRLEVHLSSGHQERVDNIVFGLRGSNVAVSAVEERCTLRDMSAYQAVTFASPSAYDTLARELRADDIAAFSTATASQPAVSTAMAVFGEGRRILFTRLCGSSWYYGLSGCNVTGFVRDETGEPAWRPVYDSENVVVHADPRSASEGWPDLATLPVRAGGAALLWRWSGDAYALAGELPEEAEDAPPIALRPGHD